MKFKGIISIVLLSILFLGACSREVKNPIGVVVTEEKKQYEASYLNGEAVVKEKLISKTTSLIGAVTCKETESENPESEDPILLKSCTFGKYKTVSTGTPDDKGRYSYEYALFENTEMKDKQLKNSDIFNQNQNELLRQINKQLKAVYQEAAADTNNAECFAGREPFRDFEMNQLGITVENNKMTFVVSFDLGSACMNADYGSASFSFKEIEPYLK